VLADGFSCRTQIEQGDTGRAAVHLAELLVAGLRGQQLGDRPERIIADQPGNQSSEHSVTAQPHKRETQ